MSLVVNTGSNDSNGYVYVTGIEMTSAEARLNGEPAQLRCTVQGLKVYSGQISVYYKRTTEAESKTILTLVNKGLQYFTIYQNTEENISVNHKTVDYVVTINIDFKSVKCTAVGNYTCELRSQGNPYADTGYLKGFCK